jgi:hypothetical protein
MKYLLLMTGDAAGWAEMGTWSGEDIEAHIEFMNQLNQELVAAGELVDAQGLAGPDQAKIVRAQAHGAPAVTDGPFPETKEFLAGYWLVDCDTPERAIEIAARTSAAPGRDGKPINMPIEVRQVMVAPEGDE